MATAQVCPVVGTTNTVLPPNHPDFDISIPGQTCPVVGATTDHHSTLQKHPVVPGSTTLRNPADASACPALKTMIEQPEQKALDEAVCPVVGPVSMVLPPDHPSTAGAKEGDVCPVTKATKGSHEGKVINHPKVEDAAGVCPVVGAKGRA